MTDAVQQLRECPFCGGNNLRVDFSEELEWHVNCVPTQDSGCDATVGGYTRPEGAIDAWNTRASSPELLAMQKALTEPPSDEVVEYVGDVLYANQGHTKAEVDKCVRETIAAFQKHTLGEPKSATSTESPEGE